MASKVFVLTHTDGRVGGLNTLLDYLKENYHEVTLLMHPLDDYSKVPTTLRRSDGNEEVMHRKPKGVLNLVGDFMLSVRILRKTQVETFIGASNFDTIPAIFARTFLRKRITRIIYYPRDYSEDRFKNKLLNLAYTQIEKIACKHSDTVISNTHRAEAKRLELGLMKERSMVLPNPVKISSPIFEPKDIKKDHFIYCGDVSREHGLHDLVETISPLIKKLIIIGSGPDWDRTIKLAKSKDIELETYKDKTHDFVINFLQGYDGIGLAPYNSESKWTYYCSPLKVGEYIASGLPVLVSNVPEIATYTEDKQLGLSYSALNFVEIKTKLNIFSTTNFHDKAKRFYEARNYNRSYTDLDL